MQIKWWQKWLSYFYEIHVESAPSEINPHLYVSVNQGRYQLSTANAVYSHEDKYTNFLDAFRQINLDAAGIEDVLILGLGLGSIPQMLEQQFGKQYHYTAVEIDENVLYLANKYTLADLASSITTICADAHVFLQLDETCYDLICMDIFLDDTIPSEFEEVEFLELLRDHLTDRGLLLYNRLALLPKDKAASRAFLDTFQQVFPTGTYLDLGGNWMFVNKKV
ncbi:MAG TPA: fused MFS/spermidine synthase [Saprospiraceae bacterium]|nr:fused MFS/spermidine synthase [Saprospiraceae bacterium]HMQ83067.1 fused MFS/spermidine synthase [Saprospiraceae bacterium]